MMRWLTTGCAFVAILATAGLVPAQTPAIQTGVHDRAHLFSESAVEKADQSLRKLGLAHHRDIVIETVESLDGETAENRAVSNAKALKLRGLYILIAKAEHKFWVARSHSAEDLFTKADLGSINTILLNSFKERQFDQGLLGTVADIERIAAKNPGANRGSSASPAPPAPARVPVPDAEVPDVAPPAKKGSALPMLLFVGLAVIILLFVVSRLFRGSQPQSAYGAQQGGPGYGAMPPGGYGAGMSPQGPGAAPPYGYGPGAGPGPGYGGPPPRQGGGFVSSALGGIGGAVVGNILYDQFGRPHTPEGHPIQGDVAGSHGVINPSTPEGTDSSYSDHASSASEGSWGAPAEHTPSADADWSGGTGVGGDWGSSDASSDAGTGGDWGGGGSDDAGASNDWGGGGSDDAGAGGDWGGGDSGGDDSGQGGSW